MDPKKVLIIGAGISGLAAAKYALDSGLAPLVLERNKDLGGIWNPQTGSTWNGLCTNFCKYNAQLSDLPYPEDTPMFPLNHQVFNYLKDYASKFNLLPHIRFDCKVTRLEKVVDEEETRYRVSWRKEGKEETGVFPFVVVAAGMFSQPHLPSFKGIEKFKGTVLHSKDYKGSSPFAGKRVLTLGSSVSGSDLPANVAKDAAIVHHCFRVASWVFPHFVQIGKGQRIPFDLVMLTREYKKLPKMCYEEQVAFTNKLFSTLCSEQ